MGDLFTLQAGKNIAAKDIYPEFSEIYKYPCFGGNGIRGFVSNFNRNGDFPIIGRQGALCGNVNLAIGDFYATEHAVVVERFSDTDLMWTYYVLIALNLNQYATATAQPGLAVNVINDVIVPVPPLQEQCRISKAVTRLFSLINEIEHGKQKLQGTIKQTKSKVLDLAIHGKLVPQDLNDEPANELLKRINPKAEIITDNGHYQKLPEGWCVCHINEISKSLLGKTLDRTKDSGEFKRYVCAVNVQWGYFDFTTQKRFRIEAKDFERYAVKKGDLLICEGGDVGRCAIWDNDTEMYYQNALHRVRCKFGISEKYLQYSLWHFKLNGVIDSLCKGVTIKHFTQSTMNKLEIPLPPFAEQKRIVSKIEEIFHQLDMIEESL